MNNTRHYELTTPLPSTVKFRVIHVIYNLTIFLLLSLLIGLFLAQRVRAKEEAPTFLGTSPPISNSTAALTLNDNPQVQTVFQWVSEDPVLGEINTGEVTATVWNFFQGSVTRPARLVFTGSGDGAHFRGNVLFEPYNRAVVEVVKFGQRVRYLLLRSFDTDLGLAIPDLVDLGDIAPSLSEEQSAPFDHLLGKAGGPGGFGGPPAASGFPSLIDPFRIENFILDGTTFPRTMTLNLTSNVAVFSEMIQLQEQPFGLFVDEDDSLAIEIVDPAANNPTAIDTITIRISSTVFGSLRNMRLFETTENSKLFQSRTIRLVANLSETLSDTVVDTISISLDSNLVSISENGILTETEADSRLFEGTGVTGELISMRIVRSTSFDSGQVDDFSVAVTSPRLGLTEEPVDAVETMAGSLEFRTDALSNNGTSERPSGAAVALKSEFVVVLGTNPGDFGQWIPDISKSGPSRLILRRNGTDLGLAISSQFPGDSLEFEKGFLKIRRTTTGKSEAVRIKLVENISLSVPEAQFETFFGNVIRVEGVEPGDEFVAQLVDTGGAVLEEDSAQVLKVTIIVKFAPGTAKDINDMSIFAQIVDNDKDSILAIVPKNLRAKFYDDFGPESEEAKLFVVRLGGNANFGFMGVTFTANIKVTPNPGGLTKDDFDYVARTKTTVTEKDGTVTPEVADPDIFPEIAQEFSVINGVPTFTVGDTPAARLLDDTPPATQFPATHDVDQTGTFIIPRFGITASYRIVYQIRVVDPGAAAIPSFTKGPKITFTR